MTLPTPAFKYFDARMTAASERATGPPAIALLTQIGLLPYPPAQQSIIRILDNGTSSGNLPARLYEHVSAETASNIRFVCGDLEPKMVQAAAERCKTNGWNSEAMVVDAEAPPFENGTFDFVTMNFGPQLLSDAPKAMAETFRILRPGGRIGFTCWASVGWLPSVQKVLPDFNPAFRGRPWTTPVYINQTLGEIGFRDVKIAEYDFTTCETDVDGYLQLMRVLLANTLTGEKGDEYAAYMKEEYGTSGVEMAWQALIVTASR